jgi:cytidine deaminase
MTLLDHAEAARKHAVAKYSGYAVGAALESADGRVFTGCNIENATYGLTICAERVAIFKALSEGVREFRAIAVAAAGPVTPCGACRQLIWEFCGDIPVTTTRREYRMSELLPDAFDDRNLR